jgi:hypothetical protein
LWVANTDIIGIESNFKIIKGKEQLAASQALRIAKRQPGWLGCFGSLTGDVSSENVRFLPFFRTFAMRGKVKWPTSDFWGMPGEGKEVSEQLATLKK